MKFQAFFEQSYTRFFPEIYRFVFSMVRSENEAKELAQDTFLAFLEEIQKGEMPTAKVRPWLYRVSKNKTINALRAPKHFQVDLQMQAHTGRSPEVVMTQKEEAKAVADVMSGLHERDATLLRLYAMELSYAEIAEVVGIERSSVGKMLNRAKQAFRRKFEKRHRTLSASLSKS